MTTPEGVAVAKSKGGPLRGVLGSMWGYWLVLLAFSLGLAAVIYFIWLRGRV